MLEKEAALGASDQVVRQAGEGTGGTGVASGDERPALHHSAAFCEVSWGNLEAMLKASDIFVRGLQVLNTAAVGTTWMAIDDAVAETRTAMSCRSLSQLIALEADTVGMAVGRYLFRASILGRIATQLVQDALFPLERRLDVAFGLLGGNASR